MGEEEEEKPANESAECTLERRTDCGYVHSMRLHFNSFASIIIEEQTGIHKLLSYPHCLPGLMCLALYHDDAIS